jgi:indole-3-glycerol phosphate synthase
MRPGTDFLSEVMARGRERLRAARRERPLEAMRERALEARRDAPPHALRAALANSDRINVIAEIKRASPSKGVIRESADPGEVARAYASGGAAAVSVLTEGDYFKGSLGDLSAARAAVALPILRKDFVFDEYQLYESAAAGTDAVLLIASALDDSRLASLREVAEGELALDALVEVHDAAEMRRASACGARLIGVNNRNLRTLEVSLGVSVDLSRVAPAGALLVSESGLGSGDALRRLKALGYNGFLIGESLMRADDPAAALRGLIAEAGF